MDDFKEIYEAVTSLIKRYDVRELLSLDGKYLKFESELLNMKYLAEIGVEEIWTFYKNAITIDDHAPWVDFTEENREMLVRLKLRV